MVRTHSACRKDRLVDILKKKKPRCDYVGRQIEIHWHFDSSPALGASPERCLCEEALIEPRIPPPPPHPPSCMSTDYSTTKCKSYVARGGASAHTWRYSTCSLLSAARLQVEVQTSAAWCFLPERDGEVMLQRHVSIGRRRRWSKAHVVFLMKEWSAGARGGVWLISGKVTFNLEPPPPHPSLWIRRLSFQYPAPRLMQRHTLVESVEASPQWNSHCIMVSPLPYIYIFPAM